MSSQTIKVAYFYSDRDRNLVDQVKSNLNVLQGLGYIELWSTRDVFAAQDKTEELKKSLREAKIVLYFFSADFLGSPDYLNLRKTKIKPEQSTDLEIEAEETLENWILKNHEQEHLRVLPILLENIAGFEDFPYSQFSVLPSSGKSLRSYGDRAARIEPCFEIGETIKEIVKELRSGSKPIQVSRLSKMPPLPVSLLPQLCNRTKQNSELEKVFNEQTSSAGKKPLVCVIHGDTEECPGGFKARLEKRDIYQFLRLDYAHAIKTYNLQFPHERFDTDAPQQFFERNLSEKFFDTLDAKSKDELFYFVTQFRTVVINYEAFSENWNENVMKAFLEFWNNAPIQNAQTTIIINLFFSYDENTDSDIGSNAAARDFFKQLQQPEFACYQNINIAVLSELDAVEKIEVINWVNSESVFKDFCSRHTPAFCDDFLIRQIINDLYGNKNTPRRFVREIEIPGQPEPRKITVVKMRTLSDKLGNLLAKKRCRL